MSLLRPAINAEDHQIGSLNAAVTLVEFGDFQCPHCRLAHPLIQRLLKEMGSNLHFVFRNFPLAEIHPYAFMAALASEAAGKQNKFWEMHDLIFEHQEQLSPAFLRSLLRPLKLDEKQFERDWKGAAVQEKVKSDFESGVRSGVNGTPTFFLNGKPILTYDETYESLAGAIQLEAELLGL